RGFAAAPTTGVPGIYNEYDHSYQAEHHENGDSSNNPWKWATGTRRLGGYHGLLPRPRRRGLHGIARHRLSLERRGALRYSTERRGALRYSTERRGALRRARVGRRLIGPRATRVRRLVRSLVRSPGGHLRVLVGRRHWSLIRLLGRRRNDGIFHLLLRHTTSNAAVQPT
ncbi:MAG: hypothetical protein JXA67_19050, partial [Micromonosporaceae bacterium]|nr:hypothetical protein [Micromonosporaceae bacterium]